MLCCAAACRASAALTLGGWLLALPALAQPAVTSLDPARNVGAAPLAGNVVLTFSQAIAANSAGNVRVFSQQRGGQLNHAAGGGLSGGGTATLTFDPVHNFRPGETVFVTVPNTVVGLGGAPAVPHVHQFTAAAVGGTGFFGAPTNTPDPSVGLQPMGVAVGDIDGDGDLDLLTANAGNGTVSVRHNNGAGTYNNGSPDIGVGVYPASIALGDVDGDGDLDLLAANSTSSGTISVRLNNGAGGFSNASGAPVPVGSEPISLVLGDVDGDGDLDFVVANSTAGENSVSVRLNDGAGQFSGSPDISVGATPLGVVLGDVDGDGDLDLLTANTGAGTVSARRNTGAGVFGGAQAVTVNASPTSLTLGDIDGDGDLDLLTAHIDNGGLVRVLFNDGAGTFTTPSVISVGRRPTSVVLADVDGDDDLDLLTADYGSATVSVGFNDGAGAFSGIRSVSVGLSPASMAIGDVDGDGDLDLLTASYSTNTASVRLNGGTGAPLAAPVARAAPAGFSIGPNPAAASTAMRLTGAPANHSLRLLDATGRCVRQLRADATGAAHLPPPALPAGLYLLRTADGRTARLVLE